MSNGEQNPYIYKLEAPLKFTKGGDFEETLSLEMEAPSMSEYDEVADLSQAVMSAMMSSAKHNLGIDPENLGDAIDPVEDLRMGAQELRIVMLSAPKTRVRDLARKFRTLAVKVGTLDGKIKIKDSHLNKLSIADFDGFMFGCIANFICPSLFSVGEESKAEESGSD